MDGQVFVSTHDSAGQPLPHATRGDRARWEARQAGIPLELTLVDGQIVLRATRWDGARLRLTGSAEGLAELVNEIAGLYGLRLTAREPARANRGDC
jgi:hypothetical protein